MKSGDDMNRTKLVGWSLATLLALVPLPALAQATGAISGVVSDASGAALPGASVTVVNSGTGQTRTATAGTEGFYTVPLLQPGTYRVTASLQGFSAMIRDGIKVTVSETARVNLQLPVGGRTEDVTVVGEAPLVETSNATMGIVIDEKKVVDLPLNGRNFTQLGTLIPGVVAPPAGLGGQNGDATPGGFGNATGGFNVNGQRNQSNNFLLDGATNNDTFNTGFVLRPPPDAIQEFKILTHSYNAEYGGNVGSVVNVVTKSGSNTWHGAAWEFNRDDSLQAYNFFARRPAQAEPQAEPVRRLAGRPAQEGQAVRVRLLRGLSKHERHDPEPVRAVGRAARRQLRGRHHPRPADGAAVPRRDHPVEQAGSGRREAAERLHAAAELRGKHVHRLAGRRRQAGAGGRPSRLSLQRQAPGARALLVEPYRPHDAAHDRAGGREGRGEAVGRDAVGHLHVQRDADQPGALQRRTRSTHSPP
jgi:hypothetical protein